ncbi:MAG: 4'-phosphopantetheinyl transferase superfamily protein, partial [Ginsengibacter sp.]
GKEMDSILNAENIMRSFYNLWTQKEAFLKAIGTGLHVPLNKIEINNSKITWNKKDWFLNEIVLDNKYVSHICTDIFLPEIVVQKINFQ